MSRVPTLFDVRSETHKEVDVATSVEGIRALVERAVSAAGEGYELWDVEATADTVRVLVDRRGGIDLDALSKLDVDVISPLLEAHPELTPAGHFSLEVSSPGLERPLRRPEHFARYVGREVSVKTAVAVGGQRRWQGILQKATESEIFVEWADGTEVTIALAAVDRARSVLNWGPSERPGKQKKQAVKRPAADVPSGDGKSVAFTERTAE